MNQETNQTPVDGFFIMFLVFLANKYHCFEYTMTYHDIFLGKSVILCRINEYDIFSNGISISHRF